MSAVLPVFGRSGYPIAELTGMASASMDDRLSALQLAQDVEDASEFDGGAGS